MIQLIDKSNSKYNIPLKAPRELVCVKNTTLGDRYRDKYNNGLDLVLYLSLDMPRVLYFLYIHAVVL